MSNMFAKFQDVHEFRHYVWRVYFERELYIATNYCEMACYSYLVFEELELNAPEHPSLIGDQLFLERGVTEEDVLSYLPYCSGVRFDGDISVLPISQRLLRVLNNVTLTALSKPLDKAPHFKHVQCFGLIIQSIADAKVLNSIIKNTALVSRFHIPSGLFDVAFESFKGEWVVGQARFLLNPTPKRVFCYEAKPDIRCLTQFIEDVLNKEKTLRLSNRMEDQDVLHLVFNLQRQVRVMYKNTFFNVGGVMNTKFHGPLSMIKTVVNLLLLQTSGVCWSKNKRRVLRSPELQGLLREMLF